MTDTDLCTACYQYPPETPGMWICTRCADQWHYHLTALIGYRDDRGHWQRGWLDELGVENRRQARKGAGGPRVTASPERPEPANRAASDVAQEIRFHLVTAALQLAKVDGLELPADRLGSIIAWHVAHEDRMGRYGGAGEIVTGLDSLIRKVQRVIDTPPEKRYYLGVCPTCEQPMRAYRPAGWHECCGVRHDVEQALVGIDDRLRDPENRMTLTEIAQLTGESLPTLGMRVKRKKIAPVIGSGKGARYRFGDVSA